MQLYEESKEVGIKPHVDIAKILQKAPAHTYQKLLTGSGKQRTIVGMTTKKAKELFAVKELPGKLTEKQIDTLKGYI